MTLLNKCFSLCKTPAENRREIRDKSIEYIKSGMDPDSARKLASSDMLDVVRDSIEHVRQQLTEKGYDVSMKDINVPEKMKGVENGGPRSNGPGEATPGGETHSVDRAKSNSGEGNADQGNTERIADSSTSKPYSKPEPRRGIADRASNSLRPYREESSQVREPDKRELAREIWDSIKQVRDEHAKLSEEDLSTDSFGNRVEAEDREKPSDGLHSFLEEKIKNNEITDHQAFLIKDFADSGKNSQKEFGQIFNDPNKLLPKGYVEGHKQTIDDYAKHMKDGGSDAIRARKVIAEQGGISLNEFGEKGRYSKSMQSEIGKDVVSRKNTSREEFGHSADQMHQILEENGFRGKWKTADDMMNWLADKNSKQRALDESIRKMVNERKRSIQSDLQNKLDDLKSERSDKVKEYRDLVGAVKKAGGISTEDLFAAYRDIAIKKQGMSDANANKYAEDRVRSDVASINTKHGSGLLNTKFERDGTTTKSGRKSNDDMLAGMKSKSIVDLVSQIRKMESPKQRENIYDRAKNQAIYNDRIESTKKSSPEKSGDIVELSSKSGDIKSQMSDKESADGVRGIVEEKTPITEKEARDTLDSLSKELGFKTDDHIIHQNVDAIPEDVVEKQVLKDGDIDKRSNFNDTQAFYDKSTGKIHYILDNMSKVDFIREALRHEVIHSGMANLREKLDMQHGPMVGGNTHAGRAIVDSILDRVADKYEGQMDKIVNDYKLDMTDPSSRRQAAEEWLAYHGKDMASKWYDRYVAATTRFIRNSLGKIGIDVKWTDVETRDLISKANDAYREGSPYQNYMNADSGIMAAKSSAPTGEKFHFDVDKTDNEFKKALVGKTPIRLRDKIKEWGEDVWRQATRHFKEIPNTPFFSQGHEILKRFELKGPVIDARVIEFLKNHLSGMDEYQFHNFNARIQLENMKYNADNTGSYIMGLDKESLERNLDRIRKITDGDDAIKKAYNEYLDTVHDTGKELVRVGLLNERDIKNKWYFHQEVEGMQKIQSFIDSNGSISKKTPGFTKQRGENTSTYQMNYIDSMFKYLTHANRIVALHDMVDELGGEYNLRKSCQDKANGFNDSIVEKKGVTAEKLNNEWLSDRGYENPDGMSVEAKKEAMGDAYMVSVPEAKKQELLGGRYRDWREFIPDTHDLWQFDRDNFLTSTKTIVDRNFEEQISNFVRESTENNMEHGEMIKQLLKQFGQDTSRNGSKEFMVLPKEIISQINYFRPKEEESALKNLLNKPVKYFKVDALFSPKRVVGFNLKGALAEIETVTATYPGALKISALKKSIGEIKNAFGGKASNLWYEMMERGVVMGGETYAESPNIKMLSEFQHLLDGASDRKGWAQEGWGLGKDVVGGYLRLAKQATAARENLFRASLYMHLLERLNKGESMDDIGYGASNPGMIDAIKDNRDKAAALTRGVTGDYTGLTVLGKKIKDNVAPFWSFMEVQMKRYPGIFTNAIRQGIGKGIKTGSFLGLTRGVAASSYLALRASAYFAAINAYNQIFHQEEEEQLSTMERSKMHIILGRNDDGTINYLPFQGALADWVEWLGGPDVSNVMGDVYNGKKPMSDIFKEYGKVVGNKLIGSLRPDLKDAISQISGQEYYPDAFHPKPMNDRMDAVLRTWGINDEYNAAFTDKPSRGYAQTWTKALYRTRDPLEGAYNEIRQKEREWKEREKGEYDMGAKDSPKIQALRTWKQALKLNDQKAADKAYEQVQEFYPHQSQIRSALKGMDPLSSISNKKDKKSFLDSLDERDMKQYEDAKEYYRTVLARAY